MLIRTSIGSYARLITSKTRVAPNKNDTVREALEKQLVLESVYLWLDSITAIKWIIGKKE